MVLVMGLCPFSSYVVSFVAAKNHFSAIFGLPFVFFDFWLFVLVSCFVELVEGLCCWNLRAEPRESSRFVCTVWVGAGRNLVRISLGFSVVFTPPICTFPAR